MKKIGLVVAAVLLIAILGVSCNYEMPVLECNLRTKGIDLEISNVTYQYSVVKIGTSKNTTICDWTDFDINAGFSVKNLKQGEYSFLVRGTIVDNLLKSHVVVSGSETRTLNPESQNNITIVLYPQFDKSSPCSKLQINLFETTSKDLSAKVVCKYLGSGVQTISDSMSNCDTGFVKEFTVVPGYYEVSVALYQNNVEVGGNVQVVMVPTGFQRVVNLSIRPRNISDIYDIRNYNTSDKILEVKKDTKVTLALPGDIGSDGNGYWMIGNSIVEDSASYIKLSTSNAGEFIVTYYRGLQSWPCKVNVTAGKKAVVNIMNFRAGYKANEAACIGYKYSGTDIAFPIDPTEVVVPDDFDPMDYTTLNLVPVQGSIVGAEFVELASMDQFDLLMGDKKTVNSSIKKLIVHGNITYNFFNGRMPNLEEILIIGASSIEGNAFKNMTNLKTVRIIPTDLTSLGPMVFSGSGVTSVIVYGSESNIKFGTSWSNGSSVTKDSFTFNAELPL